MAQGKPFTAEQKQVIIESLRPHLELGFSRSKACKLIGLDETTLSKWATADEALSMKLQGWENTMNALAIANIQSAVIKEAETEDTKKETSKWWLERKMKEDFSLRMENTGADGKDLPTPILGLFNEIPSNNSTQEDS